MFRSTTSRRSAWYTGFDPDSLRLKDVKVEFKAYKIAHTNEKHAITPSLRKKRATSTVYTFPMHTNLRTPTVLLVAGHGNKQPTTHFA